MTDTQSTRRVKPGVVVLATGGTIAGEAGSRAEGGYASGVKGIDQMLAAVPDIGGLALVRAEQIANVGSQDITFAIMIALAEPHQLLLPPVTSTVSWSPTVRIPWKRPPIF